TWICFIAHIVLLGLICSLIQTERLHMKLVLQNVWRFTSPILAKAFPNVPKSWPSRTIIATWLMMVVVFLGAFSGSVRDLMMKPKSYNEINTLEDLCKRKELTVIVV